MSAAADPYPKIELHVHLEATLQPARLLELARRNGVALPADSVEGLREFCRFSDFPHFIDVWIATTQVLRTARDYREMVVDYAVEASGHGCVYLEAILTPVEAARRGTPWQEVMEGACDGSHEAKELTGVEVRLTLDTPRGFTLEEAKETARWGIRYRERGVVALGLGGLEAEYPPEPFAPAFALARAGGLGSVPHAGEAAGPASIRGALETLAPDRIRHGVRAVEDDALLAELAARGIVLDVTPISNLRTGVVSEIGEHPLPRLLAAGIPCSISTDDPALMDTDLSRDCAAAVSLGHTPRGMFEAGLRGALCDEQTRERLREIGERFDWGGGGGGGG